MNLLHTKKLLILILFAGIIPTLSAWNGIRMTTQDIKLSAPYGRCAQFEISSTTSEPLMLVSYRVNSNNQTLHPVDQPAERGNLLLEPGQKVTVLADWAGYAPGYHYSILVVKPTENSPQLALLDPNQYVTVREVTRRASCWQSYEPLNLTHDNKIIEIIGATIGAIVAIALATGGIYYGYKLYQNKHQEHGEQAVNPKDNLKTDIKDEDFGEFLSRYKDAKAQLENDPEDKSASAIIHQLEEYAHEHGKRRHEKEEIERDQKRFQQNIRDSEKGVKQKLNSQNLLEETRRYNRSKH